MSRHLLAITVGPVQDFISAARRTRDFWYGSFVLSEISKAVARELAGSKCDLIFPAPLDPAEELKLNSELNVANIVLTISPAGSNPEQLAEKACQEARAEWRRRAEGAMAELVAKLGGGDLVDHERLRKQVDDVIESYAAWVAFDPAVDDYKAKRARVMRLLNGDKSCRLFGPSNETRIGIPKSSLDGSRETLFKKKVKVDDLPRGLSRRLRLGDGEQLDAIGLTKRLGEGPHPSPSVSRIAVDPWARGCASQFAASWKEVVEECGSLTNDGLARVTGKQFATFPYEGQVLYRTRLKELSRELKCDTELIGVALGYLYDESGGAPPDPYFVLLAADGDGVGAAISGLERPEDHKAFSRALAKFAGAARRLVAEHHGFLVYAGGDDLLAFLPLDTALECARQIHESFSRSLKEDIGLSLRKTPTLSVGLAIGHYMEPLENLLGYAREAEKSAKGTFAERDGLAVHYHPGSGAPVRVQGQWTAGMGDRIEKLAILHRDGLIGDKAAYDLRELSRLYEHWEKNDASALTLREDVKRLLSRKPGTATLRMEVTGLDEILKGVSDAKSLRHLAEEIIVAREIGRAQKISGWVRKAAA